MNNSNMIEDSENTDTCPVQSMVEHSAQHFGLVVDRPLNTRPKQPFTYCCGRTKTGRKAIEEAIQSRRSNIKFVIKFVIKMVEGHAGERHLTASERVQVSEAIRCLRDAVLALEKIEFYEIEQQSRTGQPHCG